MAKSLKWPRGKKKDWCRAPVPLGTVSTRRRGTHLVRMIKVRNIGPKAKHWVEFARHRWEQMHGPVPPGLRVIHLDGDSMNDEFENYALMSGGQWLMHLRRIRPGMADRNKRAVSEATARCNRERGAVNRQIGTLGTRWYPVDPERRLIILDPCRGRWRLVARWLNGAAEPDTNGRRSLRAMRNAPLRFVRGTDLGRDEFEGYRRIDPREYVRKWPVSTPWTQS